MIKVLCAAISLLGASIHLPAETYDFDRLTNRDGNLWIGTLGGGLNRLGPSREGFTHYRHDPDDPRSLSHDQVWAFNEDRFGNLWVGTLGGGLDRMDPARNTFTGGLNRFISDPEGFIRYRHDPEDPRSLSHDQIRALLESRDGSLWIGTGGGGLDHFDPLEPLRLKNS